MKTFKIYGLRRTGTNYLQWLLQNNCKETIILIDVPTWKHGVPNDQPYDIARVLTQAKTKDYMLSNDILGMSQSDVVNNVEHPINLCCVKNPYSWYLSICRWNEIDAFPLTNDKLQQLFIWNYVNAQYAQPGNQLVPYEKLLVDPFNWLRLVCRGDQGIVEDFVDITTRVKGEGEFDKNHYVKSKYMRMFDDADLIKFNKFIDYDVMLKLGYDLEEP